VLTSEGEVKLDDSTWTETWLSGQVYLEDKRVYIETLGKKTLLYDFNLRLNDTMITKSIFGLSYDVYKHYVASIDSVQIGTEYRQRYHFKPVSGGWFFSVIEGIGCDKAF